MKRLILLALLLILILVGFFMTSSNKETKTKVEQQKVEEVKDNFVKDTEIYNPKDWEVLYNDIRGQVDISKIEIEVGGLSGPELGEKMRPRSLNSRVLKYFLDNPEKIPEHWKSRYVYFFGTVLKDPQGGLGVMTLSWSDGAPHWSVWTTRLNDWLSHVPSAVLLE